MKKFLSLMLALVMSLALSVPCFAAELNSDDESSNIYLETDSSYTSLESGLTANLTPSENLSGSEGEYVFLDPEEISMEDVENSILIDSQTLNFIFDEDGNLIDLIEGDIPTTYANVDTWDCTHFIVELGFSKSGSANTYYVWMRATSNSGYWFTKSNFKIKPADKSSWTSHEKEYTDSPTFIYDMIGFTYYGGANNVTVKVDGSYSLRGQNGWAWSWAYPYAVTLDSPY